MQPNSSSASSPPVAGPLMALSFTVFLDLVGFGMILPLLPFYAANFGASPFEVGLLFASYSLAQFVCSPFWGRLSDRVGRRRPLLISITLSIVAYVILTLAPTLAVVFAARLLAGGAAANYTIAQAYVADVTAPENRARAMGWLGAAFGMGFVVGPAIGGGLSYFGAEMVPAGAAVLALFNLALVWHRVPETRERATDPDALPKVRATLRRSGHLRSLLVLYGIAILAFSAMEATLALFCEQRLEFGIRETSMLLVFVGLVMAAVQGGLIGRLVARFGESHLLTAGLAAMSGGLLLLADADSLGSLLVAATFMAIGSALFNPTAFSLMSQLTSSELQGSVLGVARSLGALARVVGPIWGGWAFHRLGIASPFLSAGALLALTALAALWIHRRYGAPAKTTTEVGEALSEGS